MGRKSRGCSASGDLGSRIIVAEFSRCKCLEAGCPCTSLAASIAAATLEALTSMGRSSKSVVRRKERERPVDARSIYGW
jgi:hypothetical protein